MNEIEQQLLAALVELERLVGEMPKMQPKPDLRPLFARIEDLGEKNHPGNDPQLLHFLHRKSYQKARVWLEQQ
jgi:hypothetical protein